MNSLIERNRDQVGRKEGRKEGSREGEGGRESRNGLLGQDLSRPTTC